MSAGKHHVIIKGVKDGLVFLLDDSCEFAVLLEELQHKLDNTHQKILDGPGIDVDVKLGKRNLNEVEKYSLRQMISRKGNLQVRKIETDADSLNPLADGNIHTWKGIVRSGQTLRYEQSIMILGDVNPGGTIISSGDIYIMGALRGTAHAGYDKDQTRIISASYLRPTQLRIAGIISRPPDEWAKDGVHMEFAYIQDGKMEIDRINQLYRIK